jgi:hypothetical protein
LHGDVAVDHLNGDPETVVVAFLAFAHLRVGFRIEEARMRVERVEHPVDGAVDQPIRRQFVDVLLVDRVERSREHPVLLRDLVLARQGGAAEKSAGQGRDEHGDHSCSKKTGGAH